MPVDAALLKKIGQWRLILAQDLAAHNDLNQQALNSAVQWIVDRLLLLRICEARGLQSADSLSELSKRGGSLVRLNALFQELGERFRLEQAPCLLSWGLAESPERRDGSLQIDASRLQTVVNGLRDPDNLDAFAGGGIELLGGFHEQYLGHAIHALEDGKVVATDADNARKRDGVYYTPTYIVEYIIDRTLTPRRDDPPDVQEGYPKILDPACGAGVFLVRAYQRLLDFHLTRYVARDPSSHRGRIRRSAEGDWRLTRTERERILLTCIHGVDLDPRAVQVTRLSLLLKLLEDDDACDTPRQMQLFETHELPDLSHNVCCGDSLIGVELPPDAESSTADATATRPPLDFVRVFPDVFRRGNGGFDVVFGNPPYINVRLVSQTVDPSVRRYWSDTYRCATGLYDLYVLFIERAYDLLRVRGRFGMIVPNKFATLDYARACRRLLKRDTVIEEITDLSSMRVFGAAGIYPYLLFWRKQEPGADHMLQVRSIRSATELRDHQTSEYVLQDQLSVEDGFAVHGCLDVEARVTTHPLSLLAKIHSGTTGFAAGQMGASLREAADVHSAACFDFIVSGNIDRYRIDVGDVRFQHKDFRCPVLPRDVPWLSDNKRRLYGDEKLVIAGMTKRLEVAWDPGGLALGVQVYAAADLQEDARYLLGILNSKLISYLFRQRFAAKRLAGGYLAINKGQLQKIPIRGVDASRTHDRKRRQRLIRLVQQRLDLERRVSNDQDDAQRERLAHDIQATDAKIDGVVFALYDITKEERKRIDESIAW